MKNTMIYPTGNTEACRYASTLLKGYGFTLTDHPTPEITHLLLDVPSFRSDGSLRSGQDISLLLSMVPENTKIVGGNLDHPALNDKEKVDLFLDSEYLCRNAAITADCALRIAAPLLKTTFRDTPTLLLGWGRIGKCLAAMLKALDCPLTVAVRKESDRAMLRALGYDAADFNTVNRSLVHYRLLFNTVPAPVLDSNALAARKDCIKIELASLTGLDCADAVIARGLPGTSAPLSSGRLIADTFYRIWKEDAR